MRLSAVYHCAMDCSYGSPLCQGIYSSGSPLRRGNVCGSPLCHMRLSLRHSALSWDCRSGSAIRARHDPSSSPLRHGIYQSASPLCHGLVFLWFNTVSWDCPSGSALYHGIVTKVQLCVMGLSLWFTTVILPIWFVSKSWDRPPGSSLCHGIVCLVHFHTMRDCPPGSPPCHGFVPQVHRSVMG